MSDMKCPICNDGKIITNLDGTYECDNPECSIYDGTHTETFEALIHTRKALEQNETCCSEWEKQALDYKAELIRTKQILEIAVDKLKGIKAYYDDSYADPNFVNWQIVARRLANDADDAIKAITALEQKDVK